MQEVLNLLKTDTFLLVLVSATFLLLIGFIVLLVRINQVNRRYKVFMKKIGNGKNIEEDLENYMYRVEQVEKQNAEIISYCKDINEEMSGCIQKIGIIRYSAFKDTGSDLSFALALLDEKNNGVVLNGIYSREMSNIYAKSVENGNSNYTLSEEEVQAIKQAIETKNIYKIR